MPKSNQTQETTDSEKQTVQSEVESINKILEEHGISYLSLSQAISDHPYPQELLNVILLLHSHDNVTDQIIRSIIEHSDFLGLAHALKQLDEIVSSTSENINSQSVESFENEGSSQPSAVAHTSVSRRNVSSSNAALEEEQHNIKILNEILNERIKFEMAHSAEIEYQKYTTWEFFERDSMALGRIHSALKYLFIRPLPFMVSQCSNIGEILKSSDLNLLKLVKFAISHFDTLKEANTHFDRFATTPSSDIPILLEILDLLEDNDALSDTNLTALAELDCNKKRLLRDALCRLFSNKIQAPWMRLFISNLIKNSNPCTIVEMMQLLIRNNILSTNTTASRDLTVLIILKISNAQNMQQNMQQITHLFILLHKVGLLTRDTIDTLIDHRSPQEYALDLYQKHMKQCFPIICSSSYPLQLVRAIRSLHDSNRLSNSNLEEICSAKTTNDIIKTAETLCTDEKQDPAAGTSAAKRSAEYEQKRKDCALREIITTGFFSSTPWKIDLNKKDPYANGTF